MHHATVFSAPFVSPSFSERRAALLLLLASPPGERADDGRDGGVRDGKAQSSPARVLDRVGDGP